MGIKCVVFFSRGKGRGHAVPDAAIARELLTLQPDLEISFVSYSTGASTLMELGHQVVDLKLPEDNSLWDTVVRAGQLLRVLQERTAETLVVSHEEFCVMPMAKTFGFRTVFLTDWFLHTESEFMRCLKYSDEVIFMDDPGIYDEPPYLCGKVSYVGPVLRDLRLQAVDRPERRARLGLPPDAAVILVAPGGAEMHGEARSPIFDLVLAAYELLNVTEKRLVWVTGEPDYDSVRGRTADRKDIIILKPHYDFTPTLLASDVVITKGNRVTVLECEALGIPSISISYGNNPVDDYRVSRIRTNAALRARRLKPDVLAMYFRRSVENRGAFQQKSCEAMSSGRLFAAKLLHSIIGASR